MVEVISMKVFIFYELVSCTCQIRSLASLTSLRETAIYVGFLLFVLMFFRLVEAFEAYILCDVYVYHHACGVIFPFKSIRILSFLLLHSGLELFLCFA